MRLNHRERQRRIRDAQLEAYRDAYNVERDPGLRDGYADVGRAPIRLVCCRLVKDVNQGGILRLAEAFRCEKVSFTPEEDDAVDMAGRRGAHLWQPHEWQSAEDSVAVAVAEGFTPVALTLSERAVPLETFEWPFPLALVVGEEKFGVPDEVERLCTASVAIPIYGIVQSLNVTTALAIALNSAMGAYTRMNPDFQPVRSASRALLGLPAADYRTEGERPL